MINKIWLKQYPKDVPDEINPHLYSSLVELFEQSCARFFDRPVLRNYGTVITYGELYAMSHAFACYLQQKLNLNKGSRIAIMLPNVIQYYIALFGSLLAGLTVVNVNPLYTSRELVHQLNDAEVETIVVLANFSKTLQQALPNLPKIKNIVMTVLGDLLSCPKSLLINAYLKYVKREVTPFDFRHLILFKKALKEGKKLRLDPIRIKYDDIAFLQYTGGTTGVAKGAILTHGNLVANVEQCMAWVRPIIKEGEEVVVAPLPLYHIFSLTACALSFIRFGGECILITNPKDINSFIKELSKVPFSVFIGINTLFNALMKHPKFKSLNFKHLKLVIGGGMALQESVAVNWHNMTGTYIVEGYGLTETSPVVTINPINTHRFNNSIGLPIPSTEISIRDENGHEVALGENGELCVKGPQVMQGYWKQLEETKATFTDDGWLRTGDIGHMDHHGFVYLVDRKKDMILVSGFNVYPNEVEAVIVSHPAVSEVAVIGIPYEPTGEAVKAFIVKNDPTLTEAEMVAFCRERLTGYKIPKFIEFKEQLPKSNVGKVLRRKLKEEESSRAH